MKYYIATVVQEIEIPVGTKGNTKIKKLKEDILVAEATSVSVVEKSTPDGTPQDYDPTQIMDIHPQEFAFWPIALGVNSLKAYNIRAGFIAGSTFWTGATSLQIEYAYFGTDNNTGPAF